MEVISTAVATVVVTCFCICCVAVTCLLVGQLVSCIVHIRYTRERADYICVKRLEIERQGKAGKA